MHRQRITTVVTDLDNTLFDWVEIWYRSFDAMLTRLADDSGVRREQLIVEFKEIHERHGTSEYAFSIQELPSLQRRYSGEDLLVRFAPALDAYRVARRKAMRLYPGVIETLRAMRSAGCLIVAYTESMAYYSNYRIRRLGLDGAIDYLYSPADHDLPSGLTPEELRKYPKETYQLRWTIHRHTPAGVLKPSSEVLVQILRDVNANPTETIYVGDNLVKDVAMAKEAGVTDVYASFGAAQEKEGYQLLRKVTHWSREMVEKERATTVGDVKPTHTLAAFEDLTKLFSFDRFVPEQIREATDADKTRIVDMWKKAVDVQQHFNDLELRIRNFALTVLAGLFGAAGFVTREGLGLNLLGLKVPTAGLILLAGIPTMAAFWFMDRWWYHRLLIGAVKQGSYIEQRARLMMPEMGLTEAISRESPVSLGQRFRLRSTQKINVFYLFLGLSLLVAASITPWITMRDATSPNPGGPVMSTPQGGAPATPRTPAEPSKPTQAAPPVQSAPTLSTQPGKKN